MAWLPAGCSEGAEVAEESLGEASIAVYDSPQGNGQEPPWKLLELSANGPYGFATRDFTLIDETRPVPATPTFPGAPVRVLPTRVYYPALPSWLTASPPPNPYVPVAPGGPFPIIAYAHGITARGDITRFMAEHLASHGYIVVAPLFPLTRGDAPGGPTVADIPNQPGDLAFVMDEVAQHPDFAPSVDHDHRGILGFSAGGLTVVLAAYHPVLHIPGIQAAVAQAPAVTCLLGQAAYDPPEPVPMLILHGTADELVPFQGPELTFARAPAPVILAELIGGTHSGFMNRERPFVRNTDTAECQLLLSSGAAGPGPGSAAFAQGIIAGVGPGALDGSTCRPLCEDEYVQTMGATRQLMLTRAAMLAHFDAHLKGRPYVAQFLTKQLDREPDVEVFVKLH